MKVPAGFVDFRVSEGIPVGEREKMKIIADECLRPMWKNFKDRLDNKDFEPTPDNANVQANPTHRSGLHVCVWQR